MAASAGSEDALKRFQAENGIQTVADGDELFRYDPERNAQRRREKPWADDPHYFKHVKISALALLKMAMHARAGCPLEVMGVLQEGTETRVSAMEEGYEYMVGYTSVCEQAGRVEPVVGWYHSHPGYGCWLSGIDCNTQMTQQQHQDPFLAIVVDPVRTCSAGKVEIGAFRTYPASYKPPDDGPSEYQTIPLDKIEDFGVHCKQYYQLDVSFFKSALDSHLISLLWNKYWISTLSSSPLLTVRTRGKRISFVAQNREYATKSIKDLANKLDQAEGTLAHSVRMGGYYIPPDKKKDQSQLSKVAKDSCRVACEQIHGLMSQVLKDVVFNSHKRPGGAAVQEMQE